MLKFITKKKQLTPYALACGYLEIGEDENTRITMGNECGGVYAVKGHNVDRGQIYWEVHEKLENARRDFSAQLRNYGLKRTIPKG